VAFFACLIPGHADIVELPIVKFEQASPLTPALQGLVRGRGDAAEQCRDPLCPKIGRRVVLRER
jgi:hypothetical protein